MFTNIYSPTSACLHQNFWWNLAWIMLAIAHIEFLLFSFSLKRIYCFGKLLKIFSCVYLKFNCPWTSIRDTGNRNCSQTHLLLLRRVILDLRQKTEEQLLLLYSILLNDGFVFFSNLVNENCSKAIYPVACCKIIDAKKKNAPRQINRGEYRGYFGICFRLLAQKYAISVRALSKSTRYFCQGDLCLAAISRAIRLCKHPRNGPSKRFRQIKSGHWSRD